MYAPEQKRLQALPSKKSTIYQRGTQFIQQVSYPNMIFEGKS
jgi:hypothetical protein